MESWKYQPAADHGLEPNARLRSLKREAGLSEHAFNALWRSLNSVYLRFYHRLEVQGRERLPDKGPFIMVANHASHLDVLCLAAALPWRLRKSVFPIAAGDVFFETPVVSAFSATMLNALPMWRRNCGAHGMEQLRQRLVDEEAIYLLFPEGTRTRDGRMARFKSGIGMLVGETRVPVVPCYLEGTFEAFPAGASLPKPGKLRLRVGDSMQFEHVSNDREGWRLIAQRLEDAVAGLAR